MELVNSWIPTVHVLFPHCLKYFIFFQPQDPGFHGQEKVYGDLGEEMLEHSFEGKQQLVL